MSQEKSDEEIAKKIVDDYDKHDQMTHNDLSEIIQQALASKSTQISEMQKEIDRLNSFYKEAVRIDEERLTRIEKLERAVLHKDMALRSYDGLSLQAQEIASLKECLRKTLEALNIYPEFSEKYVDVKYSENCFREMVAKAKATAQRLISS